MRVTPITLTQGGQGGRSPQPPRLALGLGLRLLDPEMNKMSFTFLENGLPWCRSLLFLFEQPGSPPDFSAALQRSRAIFSSEPLPARMVDALERLAVLVEPPTCLLIPAVACGCAPSRALVPREPSSNGGGVGRLERLQLLSQLICLALRIVTLGGERRMRRRLAKQVSPAPHGHDDFLPSAAPRCSSSDTFDVLVDELLHRASCAAGGRRRSHR